MIVDTNRLFTDIDYKNLLIEYHSFINFILYDINRYTIYSSSVKFNEDSILYKNKDIFMQMVKDTFPTFNVTFETSNDEDDLVEGEYSISVDWKNKK